MPYAKLMHILYMKGILNDVDPASRCPDFILIDNMHMPDKFSDVMETCMPLLLIVMALHYWHYQY